MSGIEVIQAIQSIASPFWDQFFLTVTDIYSENFYMALLPVLFLVVDKQVARYLAAILIFSLWSNSLLKDFFGAPRPPEELWRPGFGGTTLGGGLPSGHAQGPATFWGAVALEVRRPWFTVLVVCVVFLIGLSRLYGGVHFPTDVLAGWAVGLAVLWLFYKGRNLVRALTWDWPLWVRLVPAIAVPILLVAIYRSEPIVWSSTGALLGLWAGSLVEERYVGYQPRHFSPLRLLLHSVLTVAVLFGIRYGLKAVIGPSEPATFIRYTVIGLTAALLMPWLFSRVRSVPVTQGRTRTF
jgi:membrane-associated phospholipid phosphatase